MNVEGIQTPLRTAREPWDASRMRFNWVGVSYVFFVRKTRVYISRLRSDVHVPATRVRLTAFGSE